MNETITTPRLMIGGISSGSGKTTCMVALCRALRRRGLSVAAFKAGPDYLDPTYHARAAQTRSHNLDAWMMGRESVLTTFASAAAGADIALIEGVMGLFDGVGPVSEEGSSAQVAKWLGAPVLLIVDASGMARTLAAIVLGCTTFDDGLSFAGVLCNRVGSRGHLDLLRFAVATPSILGGLPREPELSFPERHLGLRTADETAVTERQLDHWADRLEEWCDVERILAAARQAPELPVPAWRASLLPANAPRCRIGYAQDEAFHFYYEDNLRRLRAAGATLIPFSPIHDSGIPEVDGLLIGGGYPEVHAQALAANGSMRDSIRRFAEEGVPVYAECGGLMYLCSSIRVENGSSYPMVGLISGEAVMRSRLQALGYVEVTTTMPSILGPAGQHYRGHQFRYSELCGLAETLSEGAALVETTRRPLALNHRRSGAIDLEGYTYGQNVLASYVHGHWASNPAIPGHFVNACAAYAASRPHVSAD
ncbi:MAG TPA: cobyrinate a,c-diamide synthase [Acidobacteriaceae bacterium]